MRLNCVVPHPTQVLDSSHVPFTHHASMSNRNVIGPYDVEMASPLTREGFTGQWKTGAWAGAGNGAGSRGHKVKGGLAVPW